MKAKIIHQSLKPSLSEFKLWIITASEDIFQKIFSRLSGWITIVYCLNNISTVKNLWNLLMKLSNPLNILKILKIICQNYRPTRCWRITIQDIKISLKTKKFCTSICWNI